MKNWLTCDANKGRRRDDEGWSERMMKWLEARERNFEEQEREILRTCFVILKFFEDIIVQALFREQIPEKKISQTGNLSFKKRSTESFYFYKS